MSDPLPPPGPQLPVAPGNPYAPAAPTFPYAAPPALPPQPAFAGGQLPHTVPPARQSNVLAIIALVVSGVALVAVLAMAVFLAVSGGGGGGGAYALHGEVTAVDHGASEFDLEEAIASTVQDDGGSVEEITCPVRSQVGQGLVTVCHGSVDGFDWTGVAVFEDDTGAFVLIEV